MEQHRDSPAHSTMFSCNVCNKRFGSKQAVADHQKSPQHKRIVDQAKLARGAAASSSIKPHTPAIPPVSVPDYTDCSSNTDDEYCSDNGAWVNNSYVGRDDDQDWALCDKACGWCGHCADSVDY
ncbi:hypothetical protein BKA66DRAFT_431571 [Pyrenochaeta sp. MPI-SDFR-AT-0127]|nr:hypothetical protein BKA66DRAFT_431571 [Pyrenochaeta sp. MPI-SDFR-AT-0127]